MEERDRGLGGPLQSVYFNYLIVQIRKINLREVEVSPKVVGPRVAAPAHKGLKWMGTRGRFPGAEGCAFCSASDFVVRGQLKNSSRDNGSVTQALK